MTVARRYRVQGLVQGVGFRAWCQSVCRHFGAVGWVRNRRDASVEAWIQIDEIRLFELERQIKKGPPGADVESVEVAEVSVDPTFRRFEILPTE